MRTIHTCPLPFAWCPVCGKVLKAADRLGVEYERKRTWTFPREKRTEIIELSGQNRVPILVEDDGMVMHESGDIVQYLDQKYGTPSSGH